MKRENEFENLPVALCVDDLASVLGIGRNSVYALVRSGQIRSIRIGKQIRIPRDALRDFLQGDTR